MDNVGLKDYWAGYRNVKIYAYMYMCEHDNDFADACRRDGRSEQFISGFIAGLEALKIELASMISKDFNYQE